MITKKQFKRIIEEIKLTDGEIQVIDWYTRGCAFEIGLFVRSRDTGKRIMIQTSICLPQDELELLDEVLLLSRVQRAWTSLHMHESLETILYKGTRVFDPHCPTRINSVIGDFMLDDSCVIVEVPSEEKRTT